MAKFVVVCNIQRKTSFCPKKLAQKMQKKTNVYMVLF